VEINREEKAKRFARLHVKGAPLLLYNAWDAGSARSVLEAGAKAIATSSWVGRYGARPPRRRSSPDRTRGIVGRIVASVDAPVTVDFEGGYSADDSVVADNISRLIDLGVNGAFAKFGFGNSRLPRPENSIRNIGPVSGYSALSVPSSRWPSLDFR
jgi:2-methylisocitrate lyase-like PEP mutase family enzyme